MAPSASRCGDGVDCRPPLPAVAGGTGGEEEKEVDADDEDVDEEDNDGVVVAVVAVESRARENKVESLSWILPVIDHREPSVS